MTITDSLAGRTISHSKVLRPLGSGADALEAMHKAHRGGCRGGEWARRDPDLALIQGDLAFEALFSPRA